MNLKADKRLKLLKFCCGVKKIKMYKEVTRRKRPRFKKRTNRKDLLTVRSDLHSRTFAKNQEQPRSTVAYLPCKIKFYYCYI